MHRAASIAYPVDTGQHREQPLLHLFLPNKVEYFCDSNHDQLSVLGQVVDQNENPRRHSSGNCETIPSSKVSLETLIFARKMVKLTNSQVPTARGVLKLMLRLANNFI